MFLPIYQVRRPSGLIALRERAKRSVQPARIHSTIHAVNGLSHLGGMAVSDAGGLEGAASRYAERPTAAVSLASRVASFGSARRELETRLTVNLSTGALLLDCPFFR